LRVDIVANQQGQKPPNTQAEESTALEAVNRETVKKQQTEKTEV
jgi:hypothetical protein